MSDTHDTSIARRNIWMRGLFMLLMGFAFQVCGTVICIVTIMQFVMLLASGKPNARLVSFGRSMGRYMLQIVNFLTIASEEIPYPFTEWPKAE